jgi:hypothetical protein
MRENQNKECKNEDEQEKEKEEKEEDDIIKEVERDFFAGSKKPKRFVCPFFDPFNSNLYETHAGNKSHKDIIEKHL